MFFHPKNLESENNNPWFKPRFNILMHTQSIVCATLDSQCLEYLGYITLWISWKYVTRRPNQTHSKAFFLHRYCFEVTSKLNLAFNYLFTIGFWQFYDFIRADSKKFVKKCVNWLYMHFCFRLTLKWHLLLPIAVCAV